MKAIIPLPHITIEVDAEDQKNLFAEAAKAAEVFGESHCGLCQSTNIRPQSRTAAGEKGKEFSFFEWKCTDCGATLSFGQKGDGSVLFPKRKLDKEGKPDMETGTFGKHNGWTRYRGEGKK